MDEQVLVKAERLIERVTRKFYKVAGDEFEDLMQIGRIAVWKACNKYKISLQNFSEYHELLCRVVKNALNNESRSTRAQKRKALNTAASLNAPLVYESDFSLEDTLAAPESEVAFLPDLLREAAKKALKTRVKQIIHGVIYLLVHLLGLERHEIPKKIKYSTFVEHGLQRFLWVFFNNSPYRAINAAYRGEFMPHEMQRAPQRCWKGKLGKRRAVAALRKALLESGYDQSLYPKLMTSRFLEENNLWFAWCYAFEWDRFAYLDAAFPGDYHPWEFSVTPFGHFNDVEEVKKAAKWFVESILGYQMDQLSVYDVWHLGVDLVVTRKKFEEHGLREIMAQYGSSEPVLRMVYPDKFLPWSFARQAKWKGKAGRELAAQATRWLIEDYAIGFSPQDDEIDFRFFTTHGLRGMITAKNLGFNSSPVAALRNAYPRLEFEDRRKPRRWARKPRKSR